MRSLNSILELNVAELDELIATAKDIIAHPEAYWDKCAHKKLATLFFEPSTRTRLSFEAAMLELGGTVLGFSEASSSSASKGESVSDTARMVSCYADIIAMRHPKEGAPYVASRAATVPVINAGDGGHNHPTQTLADLLTISREMGRLDNLTIGVCGDLKYGRTVHSLIEAMSRYEGNKFVLISPEELKIPGHIRYNVFENKKIPYTVTTSLEEAMPSLDVLYMTRIQRERFEDPWEYERLKDSYVLDVEKMKLAKEKMCVLPPAPGERDQREGGRGSQSRLFPPGAQRQVYAHGADSEASGGGQGESGEGGHRHLRTGIRPGMPESQVHFPDRAGAASALPLHGQGCGYPPLRLLRAERVRWESPCGRIRLRGLCACDIRETLNKSSAAG